MFLRSLSLLGFKTFARSTEIRFEGGVTAIVGPNGSGKTNIVDSVKWVLGSGHARDLRGRKMEEVIYAGGQRRARSAFAEVTLVFDNAEGRLPVDFSEVAIKRRVERDGESDYFLNGTRVRRRDLLHLLASTGLTVDSYAIIDQSDIEHIVVCSAAERRQLLEEAAQVRGVKARREEAIARLKELAANLARLHDLKSEIEPRLESLQAQATAARDAAGAEARLELLRGSIIWEEWREVRDSHRRATLQAQSLERRLIEAREQARGAEADFQAARQEAQAAQDRRVAGQRRIGRLRLEAAAADHAVELYGERGRSLTAQLDAELRARSELSSRMAAARAVQGQLDGELKQARALKSAVEVAVPAVPAPDPAEAHARRRAADEARRAAAAAASRLAGARTRREFLESQADQASQAEAALADLPPAEAALDEVSSRLRAVREAVVGLARLRAEVEGLDALRPDGAGLRLGEVLSAEPGYEAALSAVLGSLVDAVVMPDRTSAEAADRPQVGQVTLLYPAEADEPKRGSLYEHVRWPEMYEPIACRLLGGVVIGVDVTLDGVYRESGLVRAGNDPRVALDMKRTALRARIAELEPHAAQAGEMEVRLRRAEALVADLRARSAGAGRGSDARALLRAAIQSEEEEVRRHEALELDASAADERAAGALAQHQLDLEAAVARQAQADRQLAENERWRDRVAELDRQRGAVAHDIELIEHAVRDRGDRISELESAAAETNRQMEPLEGRANTLGEELKAAERETPEEEAETAEGARRLVALEEARIDARLRAGNLEGNLELVSREAELLQARLDEIRTRMPDGVAPEEIPGGKAREKEMRALERRLVEIGPTNALAEAECRELESRYSTLAEQLQDIADARVGLESLIAQLREEEDSRYEAVFGAVAANFNEYFAELNPGGRATLRHAEGEDGPRSGVDILVQPPRKRLQNVTLLSSGERSLAALALVLALDEVNPSPFTILDEVDAALDDANVGRFGQMIARLGAQRQFLVITHNHVTMAHASSLYGIHLDESGSSHLVSVRLDDIAKPHARPATAAQAG